MANHQNSPVLIAIFYKKPTSANRCAIKLLIGRFGNHRPDQNGNSGLLRYSRPSPSFPNGQADPVGEGRSREHNASPRPLAEDEAIQWAAEARKRGIKRIARLTQDYLRLLQNVGSSIRERPGCLDLRPADDRVQRYVGHNHETVGDRQLPVVTGRVGH